MRATATLVKLVVIGFVGALGLIALASPATLTVTSDADRVRFVASEGVQQMRVEILSLAGQKLLDSGFIRSLTIDWKLQDQHGRSVSSGVYLYRVTIQDAFGQVSRRLGKVALRQETGISEITQPSDDPLLRPLSHTGPKWRQRLGQDGQDNYRIQRRSSSSEPFATMLSLDTNRLLTVRQIMFSPTSTNSASIIMDLPAGNVHIGRDSGINIGFSHFGGGGFSWCTNINAGSCAPRVRLTNSGRLGIGSPAAPDPPLDLLHVQGGDIRVGTGMTGCVKDNDGTVIAGTCPSDARLKQDVEPFPALLGKLAQLQPVHFTWKAQEYPEYGLGSARSFGLIAQEVERVLPELVTQDPRGFKAVRYNELALMLLQAIKELNAQNEQQAQAIRALQQRIEKLEKLVEVLTKK
jgi:hypothetical protein